MRYATHCDFALKFVQFSAYFFISSFFLSGVLELRVCFAFYAHSLNLICFLFFSFLFAPYSVNKYCVVLAEVAREVDLRASLASWAIQLSTTTFLCC